MRPTNRILWRWIVATVLLILCKMMNPAHAQEYQPPDLPCIPTVSDFDTFYQSRGQTFAIVWWCDLADGIHTRYWTTSGPAKTEGERIISDTLRLAGRDPYAFTLKAYKRDSTPTELELVLDIEATHAPRCYVVASGKTTAVLTSTAQHTIGPAKKDAVGVGIAIAAGTGITCVDRLSKEPDKRYCNAIGATDSKQRKIEGDAWVPCRLERAPTEGWQ